MAIGILGPLNDVINKTASEVVDSHIFDNAAKILNTLVNTSFDAEGKALVMVAIEGDASKLGRVRFRCVESADAESAESFVRDCVEPGTLVVTDGLPIYNGLRAAGFKHRPHVVAQDAESALQQPHHVHLVIALLKRWLVATHQGAVTPMHLQAYLDEFSFRFNRRLSAHRGKLFCRLMQQAVSCRPAAIKDLYASKTQ